MTTTNTVQQLRDRLADPDGDTGTTAYTAACLASRLATRLAADDSHARSTGWDFCALALDAAAEALHPWFGATVAFVPADLLAYAEPADLERELRNLMTALVDACTVAEHSPHQGPDVHAGWACAAEHTRRAAEELP